METIRQQLEREEIHEPSIQAQIDNEPETVLEAMDKVVESARRLEQLAREHAKDFNYLIGLK